MSDTRKVVRVSAETEEHIKSYAAKREIPLGEAADRLIATAVSRLNALARYGSGAKPVPRKPAKKTAAKKASAKPAKAKPQAASAPAEAQASV